MRLTFYSLLKDAFFKSQAQIILKDLLIHDQLRTQYMGLLLSCFADFFFLAKKMSEWTPILCSLFVCLNMLRGKGVWFITSKIQKLSNPTGFAEKCYLYLFCPIHPFLHFSGVEVHKIKERPIFSEMQEMSVNLGHEELLKTRLMSKETQ